MPEATASYITLQWDQEITNWRENVTDRSVEQQRALRFDVLNNYGRESSQKYFCKLILNATMLKYEQRGLFHHLIHVISGSLVSKVCKATYDRVN